MSSKSGDLNAPVITPPGQTFQIDPHFMTWLILALESIVRWGEGATTKIKEIETLSVDGQGLNLTMYSPTAKVEKRDGVTILFSGDPNAAGGSAGFYTYSAASDSWLKV